MLPCPAEKSLLWLLSPFGYKKILPTCGGGSFTYLRGKGAYLTEHLKFRKTGVVERYYYVSPPPLKRPLDYYSTACVKAQGTLGLS